MNLREKLKAIDTKPHRAEVQQKEWTSCFERVTHLSLEQFSYAFDIDRHTVMLMQGAEMPPSFDPRKILYLDTETTGLSNGAGTIAFEIGLGYLTDCDFTIIQLVMRDYPEERFLLERVQSIAADFDVLCTFNGKTFDIPLLEQRFRMNRMQPNCLYKPHIDLLHIARRIWKLRLGRCNLSRLQEVILGQPREDDLPGKMVPERYFSYLKNGQFQLLEDVLKHNHQDIASLCILFSHMCYLYKNPDRHISDKDVFSMGKSLQQMKHYKQAQHCYKLCKRREWRIKGQLRNAVIHRRSGYLSESVTIWQNMLAAHEGGITPYIELAKYYEHRKRNYQLALILTEQAMAILAEPTIINEPRMDLIKKDLLKRYTRLKTKMHQATRS